MDKVIDFSKKIISEINNKHIAIDMTCGRGNDTLFLAKMFTNVYAFDIQDEAINETKELLNSNNINNVTIIKDNFINVCKYVLDNVDCVMYNLGYLPKGDKNIHTETNDTIKSISEVMKILSKDGIISICFYPGFPSGKDESIKTLEFLKSINQKERTSNKNCPFINNIFLFIKVQISRLA